MLVTNQQALDIRSHRCSWLQGVASGSAYFVHGARRDQSCLGRALRGRKLGELLRDRWRVYCRASTAFWRAWHRVTRLQSGGLVVSLVLMAPEKEHEIGLRGPIRTRDGVERT